MKPFYMIQSLFNSKPFIHETDIDDDNNREKLIEMLAQGQFDTGYFDKFYLVDVDAGTIKDVSQDIADALHVLSHANREEMTENVVQFVEKFDLDTYTQPDDRNFGRFIRRAA
ncbi:hypothetical protein [Methylobacterium sp. WL120]|uniref:hypothetical protein n=1 Tax=Methylobacterium sp. WL120 TaxID=2603887 RepID=UPI0011CB1E70|nr:hypothetical protein [Methylobacterium sp. WL120]TXM69646.1 hypothetical protein FV229_04695 [Methylobacterium sp. WL120]